MGKRWPWILFSIVLLVLVAGASCGIGFIAGAGIAASSRSGISSSSGGNSVAVIYVLGTIVSGEEDGDVFGSGQNAVSGLVIQNLRKAQTDASVKAIVLRVDSPGGGVTASDEIYNEVVKTKTVYGKPVIVSMGSLAASGGYYVSAPASKIVANITTLTGSIGVISIVPNLQGLLDKLGIETYVYKSGKYKDFSSGLRPQTVEDQAIWQSIIEDSYERFVEVVSKGRGLDIAAVKKLADGRIYTARQAKEIGLVDEFGDLPEAIQLAAKMAGIQGEPRVIHYKTKTLFSGLLGSFAGRNHEISIERMLGVEKHTTLKYLYTGP